MAALAKVWKYFVIRAGALGYCSMKLNKLAKRPICCGGGGSVFVFVVLDTSSSLESSLEFWASVSCFPKFWARLLFLCTLLAIASLNLGRATSPRPGLGANLP